MKMAFGSDLHLEFENLKPDTKDADILVLAGDISVGLDAFEWIHKNIDIPTVYVAGNHEFYGYDRVPLLNQMKSKSFSMENVHFLEDDFVDFTIDGKVWRFIGATLWTDYEDSDDTVDVAMFHAERALNDHRLIEQGDCIGRVEGVSRHCTGCQR